MAVINEVTGLRKPILKTVNLKKVIGRKTIVENISLELFPGEVFGFLGPNGAGKTTTIRMIVGLASMTEGNIYIDGHSVVSEFREAMQNVGCIVENPEMYKYMSGFDNLKMLAKLYPEVGQDRITEVIKLVGLEDAIHNKVKTYSLGMKQRLGIAQALLHHPRLLILDEPTNGLDPAGIREMRGLLRELCEKEGMAVLVSSHILSEMQQMCDRVGIINKGHIICIKTVDELIKLANSGNEAKLLLRTGDNEKACGVLTGLEVKFSKTPDGIRIETGKEKVPEIVSALSGAGVAVYGMDAIDTQSLEDIFMKLTGEEQQ